MTVKFNYEMSFPQIEAGITSVGKRAQKMREDIHKMNVSVLVQWQKTGDVRQPVKYATKLATETEGYYSQAIANWFEVHAGFTWEGKEFKPTRNKIDMDGVKAAKAEPFWQLTPPKEIKPLDIPAKIATLIKQATQRVEHDDKRAEGDDVEKLKAQVEALRQLEKQFATQE